MVKADSSWRFPAHSTRQLPNVNCMVTSFDPGQRQCFPTCMTPGINPGVYTNSVNILMPGFLVPTIPSFKMQHGEPYGLPQCSPSHHNLLPAANPFVKENSSAFCYGATGESAPKSVPGCQRRFIVFDQSGNETKIIYSSHGPTFPKPTAADAKPLPDYFNYKEHAARMDQTKLKLHEATDENHFSGEESEMHEETEEINALLYSDDDDYDEDDDDDDEVRSTGHSPIMVESYWTQERLEEIASSDGPNKRQKLIDGVYKKSSVVDTERSLKAERFNGNDVDVESSCAIGQTLDDEVVSILGNKQLRKDKIQATLKILESIIPGAKDKDPLSVLDEAIDYLKLLEAQDQNSRSKLPLSVFPSFHSGEKVEGRMKERQQLSRILGLND